MFRIVLNKNQSDGVSHEGPKHTKPSQSDGTPSTNQPAPHYAHSSFTCQWELKATAVLLTHLYCNLLLYQSRKCLTISVDPFRTKTWIEWLEYICILIFLLVKIFLKLHIADCCCCGVNLVSFVRPLQAEICSRHEFWWWQVVAASGGGGGVVQRLPLHHSPSHETRLGATTD